jgi:hypothetical protein
VWGSRLYLSPTLLVLKSLKTTLKDCFFKVCDLIRGREGCGGPALLEFYASCIKVYKSTLKGCFFKGLLSRLWEGRVRGTHL